MKTDHPKIGVCGLSLGFVLCTTANPIADAPGARAKVGCSFITCAVKKRGIEFCWQCPDHEACEKWYEHREWGRSHDSFVCYQRLESNIAFVEHQGIFTFAADQKKREHLLSTMLAEFNEGRSKSFYCIVATAMDIQEIKEAIVLQEIYLQEQT